jgi:hypothetical protein
LFVFFGGLRRAWDLVRTRLGIPFRGHHVDVGIDSRCFYVLFCPL